MKTMTVPKNEILDIYNSALTEARSYDMYDTSYMDKDMYDYDLVKKGIVPKNLEALETYRDSHNHDGSLRKKINWILVQQFPRKMLKANLKNLKHLDKSHKSPIYYALADLEYIKSQFDLMPINSKLRSNLINHLNNALDNLKSVEKRQKEDK